VLRSQHIKAKAIGVSEPQTLTLTLCVPSSGRQVGPGFCYLGFQRKCACAEASFIINRNLAPDLGCLCAFDAAGVLQLLLLPQRELGGYQEMQLVNTLCWAKLYAEGLESGAAAQSPFC